MDHQELQIPPILMRWCSSRLLRGPAGNCLRFSRRICPILAKRTAAAYTVVGPTCCMGREIQRSRRRLCTVYSRLRGRRSRDFECGEGAECEESSVHHQAWSLPHLHSVSAKSNSRQQCSLTWKISLAGWPPSFRPCDVRDSCRFAQDKQPSITRGSH